MPPDEVTRQTLGISALAGGVVWGLYHMTTALLSGQPVHRQDVIVASLNAVAAMLMGGLCAYFLGPVLVPWIPVEGLRDPHAVGFAIGVGAKELAPFLLRGLRLVAAKKVEELGQ